MEVINRAYARFVKELELYKNEKEVGIN